MRVKKGAKRLFRIIFITAVVIILVGVGILGYKRFFDKGKEVVKPEIVDKLDDYGYSLEKDATKLDKEMFNEICAKNHIDSNAYYGDTYKGLLVNNISHQDGGSDVFNDSIRVAKIRLGIDIKAVFVLVIDISFNLFEGRSDVLFHFIE